MFDKILVFYSELKCFFGHNDGWVVFEVALKYRHDLMDHGFSTQDLGGCHVEIPYMPNCQGS